MPSRRRISSKKTDAPRSRSLIYPGYYVKVGVKDQTVLRAVQRRLNDLGCGSIPVSEHSGVRFALKIDQLSPFFVCGSACSFAVS